jgi:hypothetical protein
LSIVEDKEAAAGCVTGNDATRMSDGVDEDDVESINDDDVNVND